MIFVTNGPPGSGKDAASEYYVEKHSFIHRTFKYELFKQTFKHFGVSEEWFMDGYNDRVKKELPETFLIGRSRREALIHVAEDIIKPNFGSDYFGKQAASNIELPGKYCFSDSGFSSELQPLINKFGTGKACLIQILRDGCDYSKDSRNYLHGVLQEEYVNGHKTEYDFGPKKERFPIRMYRIHNNGTLQELYECLEKIYVKEQNVNEETEGVFGVPV